MLVTPGSAAAPAVVRVIAIASGAVADSAVLPNLLVHAAGWSPDGRLLALVEDYSALRIVRRDGSIADSVRGPFRATVRWTPDGRGVLIFSALPVKEDDLVFFAVGRDGAIADGPDVMLPVTPTLLRGEFDIARRTGQMILASGSATWDLWTFELDDAAGPPRRRTSGTTWYGMPSISADGTRLFYIRGDATGDNLYMLTLPEAEEALTAEPYPGASASSVSSDGRHVLFGHVTASGQRLGNLDLASRQATYYDANELDTGMRPMLTQHGVVFLATDHRGLRLLAAGGMRRVLLTVPDSLELVGYVANAAGDSAAVIVIMPHGRKLAVTPLDAWQPRWLHEFAAAEYSRYVSWNRAGWIHFWLWTTGEDTPSLWQIRPGGGLAGRRGTLPAACNTSQVDIAVAADRGTCRSEDIRSDIWLVDLTRVTR